MVAVKRSPLGMDLEIATKRYARAFNEITLLGDKANIFQYEALERELENATIRLNHLLDKVQ